MVLENQQIWEGAQNQTEDALQRYEMIAMHPFPYVSNKRSLSSVQI